MQEALVLPDVGRQLDGGTAPALPFLYLALENLKFSRWKVPGYPKDPQQAWDLTAGLLSCFLRPDRGLDKEEEGLLLGTQPPGPRRLDRALIGSRVSFLTRYDGELREPLVWRQESQVSIQP